MASEKEGTKTGIRSIAFKALKATVKGLLFYAVYFILWTFIGSFAEIVPRLQSMVETFVAVYIVLMIIGELTGGTIYQHFFNAAKALFAMFYLLLTLNGGIINLSFQNLALLIDLRLLLVIAMILSLLGLAKSVLQAVNFVSEKAEPKLL
jgi:hypothetical protein